MICNDLEPVNVVNNVEVAHETGGDVVTTAAWRTASTYEKNVYNGTHFQSFSVVPSTVIEPLAQDFQRRLGAKFLS